jgi:peroxiredoxin
MSKIKMNSFMKNLILISALLILSSSFAMAFAQSTGLEKGNKAPEISLPDLNGREIPLSSLKGKLVLIDFWATWCSPCVEEQTDLARLYRKFRNSNFSKGNGFEIYGVSLDAKKPNWENFVNPHCRLRE